MSKTVNYGEQGKKLPLNRLKPGYKLFNEVRGNTGGQLFKADAVITEQDINTMRHFGVEEVWVYFIEEMREQPKRFDMADLEEMPCAPENKKRIMVVDDVASTRKNLRAILEEAGYEVVGEAEDGDEAIILSRALKPDLVTMDVVMKRMNGIDAARTLKQENPGVKVVMITSMAKPSVVIESMKAGAVNYIMKPFEPQRVTQIVKNALNS